MNKNDLEKDFDEKFEKEFTDLIDREFYGCNEIPMRNELKKYIFEQMIPKVLEEIIPKERINVVNYSLEERGYNEALYRIKQNAKEKFNINI